MTGFSRRVTQGLYIPNIALIQAGAVDNKFSGGGDVSTDLDSYTIPAGALEFDGEALEFWYGGRLLAPASNTTSLSINLGSGPTAESMTPADGIQPAAGGFTLRALFIRTGPNSQRYVAEFFGGGVMGVLQEDMTQDLSLPLDVKFAAITHLVNEVVLKLTSIKFLGI